jgi:DNA repair exonuclease SbcCD ATPase subunit
VLVQRQKEAEQEYIDQMQGRAGQAGYGPRAKQLEGLKNEKQKEVDDYDVKHASEISSLKKQREEKLAALENELNVVNKKNAENLDGLLERISIAHDIGFWLGIALTFIFLSIEMGPIFFKMMMNKGPYDYMVENYNYRMYVKNGIVKEDQVFEGNNGMILMEKTHFLEVENDRKEKIEKLKAQEELSKKVIGVWSQKKMTELQDHPDRFYTEDSTGDTPKA